MSCAAVTTSAGRPSRVVQQRLGGEQHAALARLAFLAGHRRQRLFERAGLIDAGHDAAVAFHRAARREIVAHLRAASGR